jgi:hypothetical protein
VDRDAGHQGLAVHVLDEPLDLRRQPVRLAEGTLLPSLTFLSTDAWPESMETFDQERLVMGAAGNQGRGACAQGEAPRLDPSAGEGRGRKRWRAIEAGSPMRRPRPLSSSGPLH